VRTLNTFLDIEECFLTKQFRVRMINRYLCLFFLFLTIFGLVSCNSESKSDASIESSSDDVISIVVTVGMIADMVSEIGADRVRVQQLINHGIDPHLYRPTRDDILKISKADLVLYNGLLLEGKMADVLSSVRYKNRAYAVSDYISREALLNDAEKKIGEFDPHLWMDVSLWSLLIDPIVKLLSMKDPEYTRDFQARGDNLKKSYDDLHKKGQELLRSIPIEKRILISSHDAFQYFGRAYDIEVHGVQGVSTESEAGLQRINDIVRMILDRKIPAVFVESSVSSKSMEAIIEGVSAKRHEVINGGVLYTDALGPPDTLMGTYQGMMRHNFITIQKALKGLDHIDSLPLEGKM